jgi:hypothetical protein
MGDELGGMQIVIIGETMYGAKSKLLKVINVEQK